MRGWRRAGDLIGRNVDHFKQFSDTYGHAAGDRLLGELGAFLRANVRLEDIACRYGGEEFTLILPDNSLAVTAERAERLRAADQALDQAKRAGCNRVIIAAPAPPVTAQPVLDNQAQ